MRTTTTIYNLDIMTSKLLGSEHTPKINTTLNEAFNTGDGLMRGDPKLNLLTIGMLPISMMNDGIANMLELRHAATDGNVYEPIPFLLLPFGDDITDTIVNNYRLPVETLIDGNYYTAYYGKVLNSNSNNSDYYSMEHTTGYDYTLDLLDTENMNIVNNLPNPSTNYFTNWNTDDNVTVSRELKIPITVSELRNISDAMDKLYPGRDHIIGELALCTSVERDSVANAVLVNYFVSTRFLIDENIEQNKDIVNALIIGGLEPLVQRY